MKTNNRSENIYTDSCSVCPSVKLDSRFKVQMLVVTKIFSTFVSSSTLEMKHSKTSFREN